jgi:hypothetical protein
MKAHFRQQSLDGEGCNEVLEDNQKNILLLLELSTSNHWVVLRIGTNTHQLSTWLYTIYLSILKFLKKLDMVSNYGPQNFIKNS